MLNPGSFTAKYQVIILNEDSVKVLLLHLWSQDKFNIPTFVKFFSVEAKENYIRAANCPLSSGGA